MLPCAAKKKDGKILVSKKSSFCARLLALCDAISKFFNKFFHCFSTMGKNLLKSHFYFAALL